MVSAGRNRRLSAAAETVAELGFGALVRLPVRATVGIASRLILRAPDSDGEASMSAFEILGYAALVLLIASFYMKTIIWLRLLAIASNAAVVIAGVVAPNYPILILGLAMLAVNVWRLVEMRRLVGAVSAATAAQGAPITVDW